jgi:hypothetical protein
MGASNYTFAQARFSEALRCWSSKRLWLLLYMVFEEFGVGRAVVGGFHRSVTALDKAVWIAPGRPNFLSIVETCVIASPNGTPGITRNEIVTVGSTFSAVVSTSGLL